MTTQKDLIIGTTIHHLKQFIDGTPEVDQHFVNPIPWKRALSLANSAMRTAMKFQAAMRLSQNAHLLMKRLLAWYATEGRKLILKWQAESKSDVEKLREDLKETMICFWTERLPYRHHFICRACQSFLTSAGFVCHFHHP